VIVSMPTRSRPKECKTYARTRDEETYVNPWRLPGLSGSRGNTPDKSVGRLSWFVVTEP